MLYLLNTMLKRFFYICTICTLFVVACGKKQPIETNKVTIPSWYLESVKNDSLYLYGLGEGSSLQKATNVALNDAASKLRVSISSTTETSMSADRESYSSSLKQNINAIVKDVTFNNYEVVKSEESVGSFYVKIKIDRNIFVEEKTAELKALIKDCENRYLELTKIPNVLERRGEFKKVTEIATKIENLSLLIFSLTKDGEFDIKDVLTKIKQYKAEYDSFLTKITFVVDDGAIGDVITQGLNDAGLRVTRKLTNALNSVSLTITNNTVNDQIYGRFFAKNNTFISVSSGGKLVGSKNITFSGGSSVSQQEAFKESLHSLDSMIKKEGIESIIGLK
jgi:hypothetical protein